MKKSYIIAAALAVGAAAWVVSGQLEGDRKAEAQKPPAQLSMAKRVPTVRVRSQSAEQRLTEITLRGRTEALQSVDIRAETYGRIVELTIERGARLKEGDLIARLSPEGRPAALREAKALREQRRIEFTAAQKLSEKGFRAETQLAEAEAALEAADAAVRRAEVELENTEIVAPFDGIADDRMIDRGDFVELGDGIARIVDLDPILVVAQVNELDVGRIERGAVGNARLITGVEVAGQVRFVGSMADPQTRTFRVELEVPNPDGAIPDGVSAEVRLPVGEVRAHRVSPAILSLTDAGEVGVKTINADNTVRFRPVEIVDNTLDGVWLTGLPETVTFITVGQEFVTDGQEVRPVPEQAEQAPAETPKAETPEAETSGQTAEGDAS